MFGIYSRYSQVVVLLLFLPLHITHCEFQIALHYSSKWWCCCPPQRWHAVSLALSHPQVSGVWSLLLPPPLTTFYSSTSTLSSSTYLTTNPSTSNLNHLYLYIYLPHTHMQVSGSWRVLLHIEPPSTLTLSYKLGLGGLQLMFLDALKCYKQNFLFTRDFN